MSRYLFIDSETGGVDPGSCELLQLAWGVTDDNFKPLFRPLPVKSFYMEATLPISEQAARVNGLTKEFLAAKASDPSEVYTALAADMESCDHIVGHFLPFDRDMVLADACRRLGTDNPVYGRIRSYMDAMRPVDTKVDYAFLRRDWKERPHPGPHLSELCKYLHVYTFDISFHDAVGDVLAMMRCMKEIKRLYSDTIPY